MPFLPACVAWHCASVSHSEFTAFVAVAQHLSFTKAAAQAGIALPTMSQTIRSLEDRLGVRLFNRTTRSVALTEAGERLLSEIQPIVHGIDQALESVNLFRDKPIGTLRLAVSRPSATRRLAPLLQPFMAEYPAIRLEVVVDDTVQDLVAGRFDAGIQVGQRVQRDMTALRLADDFRMLAVASPTYLKKAWHAISAAGSPRSQLHPVPNALGRHDPALGFQQGPGQGDRDHGPGVAGRQ